MKKLKYFLIIMLATFMSVSSVNAELKYDAQRMKLLNRQYSDFPFTTWYSVGEDTTYSGSNYVEFDATNSNITTPNDLPKYVYAIFCSTSDLDLYTSESLKGSISNYGNVSGGSCQVIYDGNYYNGKYYLNRWLVNQWAYYTGDLGQVYGVKWSIRVRNNTSSNLYVRLESMFVSNEMITDFKSDALLSQLIEQNSSLKTHLNEIETSANETNDKLTEVIEQDKVCTYIDKNNVTSIDKVLSSNGSIANSTNAGLTDYIKLSKSDKLQIKKEGTWGSLSTCFYNVNKQLISCIPNTSLSVNQYLTIPDNTSYARFSIQLNSNQPQFELCKNGNQALNDNLNDLNQNISSDKVDGVEGAFESFEGFIAENSTITQLITMPITLYTSILNGLQSACQPFVLGNLFGTNLTIPCVNIGNYLGSTLWSMIDIIISGFAVFSISKKFIKIFNNFSSMKEGDVIDD